MSEKPGLVARRPVHDGRIVHLSVDTVRMPDGSQKQMEHIRHAGASAILPVVGSVDEADPEILLIRQYRYSAGDWLYEVPAGTRGGRGALRGRRPPRARGGDRMARREDPAPHAHLYDAGLH